MIRTTSSAGSGSSAATGPWWRGPSAPPERRCEPTRSKCFPDRVSRRLGHHDVMNETVTVIAAVLSGLFAGLFATFSYAVMPGLRRTDDATFARAMREI